MFLNNLNSNSLPIFGMPNPAKLRPQITLLVNPCFGAHVVKFAVESHLLEEPVACFVRFNLARNGKDVMSIGIDSVSEIQRLFVNFPHVDFCLSVGVQFFSNNIESSIVQRNPVFERWCKSLLQVLFFVFPNKNVSIFVDCHQILSVLYLGQKHDWVVMTFEKFTIYLLFVGYWVKLVLLDRFDQFWVMFLGVGDLGVWVVHEWNFFLSY